MMTRQDFIESMVGIPWVNRASSFNECDCWGLVVLYYSHVLGIKLPEIAGFADSSKSIADGFFEQVETGAWSKSDSGVVFMSFIKLNGVRTPVHCGVKIGGMVLHAQGNEEKGGQVACHRFSAIKRIYKGDIELYEFIG